jgi:hypothetical protein
MIAQALGNAKEFAQQQQQKGDGSTAAGSGQDGDFATLLSQYLTFGDGSPVDPAPLVYAAAVADEFAVDIAVAARRHSSD